MMMREGQKVGRELELSWASVTVLGKSRRYIYMASITFMERCTGRIICDDDTHNFGTAMPYDRVKQKNSCYIVMYLHRSHTKQIHSQILKLSEFGRLKVLSKTSSQQDFFSAKASVARSFCHQKFFS
jgi:hypothetical protein